MDGYSQQVEKTVAMIFQEVNLNSKRSSENGTMLLQPCVTTTMLRLILDFCRLYKKSRHEKKVWNVVNFRMKYK
jgi:hypothetical protein